MIKLIFIAMPIPFSVLSAAALWQVRYLGLFIKHLANFDTQRVNTARCAENWVQALGLAFAMRG